MVSSISIKGIDELTKNLCRYNLDKQDIILVGSAVLAFNNIRENKDIEFIVNPNKYKKIPLKYRLRLIGWGHIPISNNVDLFHNFCWPCGEKDKALFEKRLYDSLEGWKVLKLKYEYKYKLFLIEYLGKREKDIQDICAIEEKMGEIIDKVEINKQALIFIKSKDFLIKLLFGIRDAYNIIWKKRK